MWTEFKIPDLTRKVPVTLNINVIIHKITEKRDTYKTVNIARARNKLLDYITKDCEYFIMIDMNYINNRKIDKEVIKKYLIRNDWDGLSFNYNNYYDIWALALEPYYISMWHWTDPEIVKSIMKNTVVNKLHIMNRENLLECISGFCGLGLYRTDKFKDCRYSGYFDLSKFYKLGVNLERNIKLLTKLTDKLDKRGLQSDCEHKYFHIDAINKHKARIRISPLILFKDK